ncbi:helix-turn-helix transcriptional regulator [Streptococcus sp. 121]|uniref:helix-turn-helix domain-containing protein n=1 Tax=Streptococcus sp. 121 TaxID=2797637 RepID=UPI0018F0D592|nr:helix-turn-helix transcriptional regulator [Streptococcus sp. 121]MBJ6746614.1 helix-turn-helix transcriptional regulator [Streptococcus sp. 121]
MNELYPFGPIFKEFRVARNLSLKEAAGEIVSPQLLSQFENGKKNISMEKFTRLLISIGVSFTDFAIRFSRDADGIDQVMNIFYNIETSGVTRKNLLPTFRKELDPFLHDNKPLKDNLLDNLIPIMLYGKSQMSSELSDDFKKKISHISFPYRNTLEKDLLTTSLRKRPLSELLQDAEDILDFAKTTTADQDFYYITIHLTTLIGTLSNLGFLKKVDDFIKEFDEILKKKGGLIPLQIVIYYYIQKTHHLLRKNDLEGIRLGRLVLDLLDNPLVLNVSSDLQESKHLFIKTFEENNNTGIPLIEE